MKILLILVLFLNCISGFSQRYIRDKTTLSYLLDSNRNIITGTQVQMRNYINNNISDTDTANFEIVVNLPANYARMIYQGEDDNIELIDLTPRTTLRIDRIRRPRQGMIRYDRTVDKLRLYTGTAWRYIQLEP